jgi:uncharacterized membrane protein YtjA (UPF0391 family)
MLYYAAVLFAVALIAAVLGFTDIATGASGIARVLCGVLAASACIILLIGGFRTRSH